MTDLDDLDHRNVYLQRLRFNTLDGHLDRPRNGARSWLFLDRRYVTRRRALVRPLVRSEVATAVQLLSPWFEKFTELYEAKIGRNEVTSEIPGILLAATEVEPTESPPTSLKMTERSAFPAAVLQRYQREQDPPPKRGRGRPLGSRDTRPRKTKNTLPPIGAEQSPGFAGKREIEAAQLQTHDSESIEAEMRVVETGQPAEDPTH